MAQTMTTPTVRPFGKLPDGQEVSLFTLEAPGGWKATITNYGAILTSFCVPQKQGEPVDVVLGFESLDGLHDQRVLHAKRGFPMGPPFFMCVPFPPNS